MQLGVAVVIGIPLLTWLVVLVYGLRKRAQGLRPFDAAKQERDAERLGGEGRHIRTADGRIVEYLVYGSKRPDAKVIVQMHGSTMTAGWPCKLNASLCKDLNLKGIAPSVPCHGYQRPSHWASDSRFPAGPRSYSGRGRGWRVHGGGHLLRHCTCDGNRVVIRARSLRCNGTQCALPLGPDLQGV